MEKRTAAIAIILLVAVTFFLGRGMTGMVTAGGPEIKLETVEVFADHARIKWSTEPAAKTTISYADNVLVFNKATEFEATLENLETNKKYAYTIKACSEKCSSFSSYFITRQDYTAPMSAPKITGNTIVKALQSETAKMIKNAVSSMFLVILAVVGILVTANIVQQKLGEISSKGISIFPENVRFNQLIRKAEKVIELGMPEEAYQNYEEARQLYQKLNPEQKVKSYERLIAVYNELTKHYNKQEIDELVEKYTRGTITQEETQRLRELMS